MLDKQITHNLFQGLYVLDFVCSGRFKHGGLESAPLSTGDKLNDFLHQQRTSVAFPFPSHSRVVKHSRNMLPTSLHIAQKNSKRDNSDSFIKGLSA